MLSEDMYQANILEHFKQPHNYGALPSHTVAFRDVNPLCGDIIEMQLQIDEGMIVDIRFLGKGCAISQASASMLTDMVKGMPVEDALKIDPQTVLGLLGVEISPARMKCAFLSLKVLKLALASSLGKSIDDTSL